MNGTTLSEACHIVNILPAVSISSGKTSQAFTMKRAEHVSILISFGAMGSLVPTSIVLNQCTDVSGANATPLGFRWYNQPGSAGNDVMSGLSWATPSGIVSFPTSIANYVYVLELDSAELEAIANVVGPVTEYPYLQVVIADSGNATIASVVAILSAIRYEHKANASVTL